MCLPAPTFSTCSPGNGRPPWLASPPFPRPAAPIATRRALRVARGDTTPLPGFDEDAYAPLSNAEAHPLAALAEEWGDVRRATLSFFRHLAPEAWTRRGTASGAPVTVRALAWIIAGHERHHLETLAERYGV
jgi:hypothetical protein